MAVWVALSGANPSAAAVLTLTDTVAPQSPIWRATDDSVGARSDAPSLKPIESVLPPASAATVDSDVGSKPENQRLWLQDGEDGDDRDHRRSGDASARPALLHIWCDGMRRRASGSPAHLACNPSTGPPSQR